MIFESKSGKRVEIVHDTRIKYFDEGGGFVNELPASEFFALYQPEDPAPRPYKAVLASLDGGPEYAAYSNGAHWNGWACPYIEHEQVVKLAAGLLPYCKLVYHPEDNTWRVVQGEDEDVYIEETIEVDGQPVKVFGIGTGSWCWDEIEGEPT